MSSEIDRLQKYIKDEDENIFTTTELYDFLEETENARDAAAEIWNIIAGNREYLEEVFGNFKSEDLQDFSEQAMEISERFSELAMEEGDNNKNSTQQELWDDFDKSQALDSLRH
uniref:Uncharacterized protein n=1 Tax=uncultured organism TaxID=155900 RepID=M1PVE3_9ZZZZ|nr:hypothetical protein FLSS-17_0017 [uncultured organism]